MIMAMEAGPAAAPAAAQRSRKKIRLAIFHEREMRIASEAEAANPAI